MRVSPGYITRPALAAGPFKQSRRVLRHLRSHRSARANVSSPPTAPQVQVFGTRKSPDTRKALRFFAERRVKTHFVDFMERGPALGELRRFSDRFGASSLVDRESRRFLDRGLQRSMYSDDWWLTRLAQEPMMLRQPLVRYASRVSVGLDEASWKQWLEA